MMHPPDSPRMLLLAFQWDHFAGGMWRCVGLKAHGNVEIIIDLFEGLGDGRVISYEYANNGIGGGGGYFLSYKL